jgi:hypothetical protein
MASGVVAANRQKIWMADHAGMLNVPMEEHLMVAFLSWTDGKRR